MVFVPITHHLVDAATVHAARQAAHLLDEMMKERGAWPEFEVVDVAVQRLVHSKYDFCHGDFPGETESQGRPRRLAAAPADGIRRRQVSRARRHGASRAPRASETRPDPPPRRTAGSRPRCCPAWDWGSASPRPRPRPCP